MNRLFRNRRGARTSHLGRRGSSLVDIVIAVWVLSMAILTMAAVDVTATRTIRSSQSMEIATQAARAQLDRWRQEGFDAMPAVATGATVATQSFAVPTELPSGTGQTVFTRVDTSQAVTTVEAGRRRVSATVTWTGRGSDKGSVTLTTLVAK
jgi:Tfp pilus assembly protein PilV